MPSSKAYALSFALLCKLCGAPDGDRAPAPDEAAGLEPDDEVLTDAALASDAARPSDAGLPAEGALLQDGSLLGDAGALADAALLQADDAGDAGDAGALADGALLQAVDAGDGGLTPRDASVGERGPEQEADGGALCGPPGLFEEGSCDRISSQLERYEPRFPLWSDGTTKERFAYLPEGAAIDATDPDNWNFPKGTRFYKTFSLDGVKLETRVMEKVSAERGLLAWTFRAYAWNAEQTAVELVDAGGRQNVLGTSHDIPSLSQCRTCHSAAGQDGANGFSAIQLNHEGGGALSLPKLAAKKQLDTAPGRSLVGLAKVPGDAATQLGLGVLHANCGHCHGGPTPRAQLTLRLAVGAADVTATGFYRTAVDVPLAVWTGRVAPDGAALRFRAARGDPQHSGIVARMSARGSKDQMPSLGSEQVDEQGLSAVRALIERLP